MLMAGCQRRSGNFQRAMDLYKQVHRRFPNNVECKEQVKVRKFSG
jgi:intraflagellar transport protein 88